MSTIIEVKVPDIGDFTDVPIIDILVKPGDQVAVDDSLITLESDKAALDIPSPVAGIIKELKVNEGDKVSEGSLILTVEAESDQPAEAPELPTDLDTAVPPTAEPVPPISPPETKSGEKNAPEQPTPQELAVPPMAEPKPSISSSGGPQATEVKVPDIGDFKDVPVIDILVKVGDTISVDDSLVTLESDKAAMDVPSPASGKVKEIKINVGDKVSEGTVILTLEGEGAAPQPSAAASTPQPATAKAPAPTGSPAPATPPVNQGDIYGSPSVRKAARELGVDLSQVNGTGRRGRITLEDVQQFAKGGTAPAATSAPASAPTASPAPATAAQKSTSGGGLNLIPWPKVDFSKFGSTETKPLSRIKKISADNLSRNWVMIPHVVQFDEADVTELEAFRKELNAENAKSGKKVTMLAFLVKACVAALQKFPEFNSSLDGDQVVLKQYYNIGFAADTPNGLLVPVIKNADRKGVVEIAQEIVTLATQAREGKLKAADMQGGTFTISSLGGLGGTAFTPIINAPEVAILGVSKTEMKPVWDGEEFVPRLMLPLSLAYDHRVVDGAAGAKFTTYLLKVLSDIGRAIV